MFFMIPTKKAEQIFELLNSHYPPKIEFLKFRNNFELLISVILSAQTTDGQVMRVVPALFEKFPDPEMLAEAETEELEKIIRSVGFFRVKAKNIKAAAKTLINNYRGVVPCSIKELIKIPGVGRKTANVVVGTAFREPAVIVDTHFKRVVFRLGLTENRDPDKIEADIRKIIPENRQYRLSMTANLHGRECCHARKPDCEKCFLCKLCSFYSSFK